MSQPLQSGFSLVPALFMLIVLSALGAVAVRLGSVQQQTVVLAMQSARAYTAARAGIAWAGHQALNSGTCTSATIALSEGGLAGFSVDTVCTSTTHSEGPNTVTVFAIEAFAHSGSYGTPDYVSRRIRSTVTDAS